MNHYLFKRLISLFMPVFINSLFFLTATFAGTEIEDTKQFDQGLSNAWSSGSVAQWKQLVETNSQQRSDWKPAIMAQYGVSLYDANYSNAVTQLQAINCFVNSKTNNSFFSKFRYLHKTGLMSAQIFSGDFSALPASMRQAYIDLDAQENTRPQRMQAYQQKNRSGADYPGRSLIVEYMNACLREEAAAQH